MERKQFLTATAAASAGAIAGFGLERAERGTVVSPQAAGDIPGETIGETNCEIINKKVLERYRKKYRDDLFRSFLPGMDSYVVDHTYGGFLCDLDIRTGKRNSTTKRAWYEGRGIWLYSFLYNNIERDPHFLEIAGRSKEFILKHRPADGSFWASSYSREGEPLSGPGDIFGNLYIAEGLAEYAKASGEDEYLEIARQITLDSMSSYDQPDYQYHSPSASGISGPRLLNHWMVFLFLATRILEQEKTHEIEQIAGRCVNALMENHMNPAYGLLNDVLNHDMSLPGNSDLQTASVGLGIQALWMVMYEAVRRQDRTLFRRSADAFRRHVRVAEDPVYGGYLRSLSHVEKNKWTLDKSLGVQEEVLIGILLLVEHTGNRGDMKRFLKTDAYVRETFRRPGYKFWIAGGDRTVSRYRTSRAEHYHHPRHLMMNLLAVERMIERGGKPSGFLAEDTHG
ncbi:MAG: AGE family epimerase/isomerase [Balneolaceae bacterium]